MKKFKQVLAILLSVMLVFAALPVSAIAEGTETTQSADSVITKVLGLSDNNYRAAGKDNDGDGKTSVAGQWDRYQDGTRSAAQYSGLSHKFGPSAATYAKLSIYLYGGVAANMALSDTTEGFSFYIDTTSANGFVTHEVVDGAWTKSAATAYENVYFDIAFRTTTALRATAQQANTQFVLGSINSVNANTSTTAAYSCGGYIPKGAIKLFNVETGSYVDAEYDFVAGEYMNCSGFAVPYGFRGYVVVDLTEYNGPMELSKVQQIIINKHGFTRPSATSTSAGVVAEREKYIEQVKKYGGNNGSGATIIGFDNFFEISDINAFNANNANAAKYVAQVGTVVPDTGATVASTYSGAKEITFSATGMDDVSNVTYSVYKLGADSDTYEIVAQTSSKLDTTDLDGSYYVQAHGYKDGVLVASNLGTFTTCAHETINENKVAPTATEKGYTERVCAADCGYSYIVEGSYVDALGVISNVNSLGIHNMEPEANQNKDVDEGIWGESNATASLLKTDCSYGLSGSPAWGPSLEAAKFAVWNGNGTGIAVAHTFTGAQAFGFYLDTNLTVYEGDNLYFDVAFTEQSIVNTASASYWEWAIGSYRYDYNEYNAGNYFEDANPVKLYNIDTGTYEDAVMDFKDTIENDAGFAVPRGFRGYVIVDMSTYKEDGKYGAGGYAVDLEDIQAIRVDVHRTVSTVYFDAEGKIAILGADDDKTGYIRKYPQLTDTVMIFDNFFNINDIASFENDLEGYLAEVGTFAPDENMTLSSTYTDANTIKLETTGMDAVEDIVYNIHQLAANNDGYVLVKTVEDTTLSAADFAEGTYYIQAVGTLNGEVVASELLTFTACAHESFTDKIVAPTGVNKGYILKVCANECGYSYIDENSYTDALGIVGKVFGLNGSNMIPTSTANEDQEDGKWGRLQDGVIFAGSYPNDGYGPGASSHAVIQTYVYGGIAVNMPFTNTTQGFGYYIDNTRAGGFVTGTWDEETGKGTASAAGDYEQVYFDLVFRTSGTLSAQSISGTTQYVLGSFHETTAAGGSVAWKKGKYFEDGAVKLYNIDTGEYTTVEYDFGGTLTSGAGFAIPAGFRGYVIVDLTKYTGESVMPLASVKQVGINKHGLYNNETKDYYVGISKYGGNANAKLLIGYDNFFQINDIAEFEDAMVTELAKFSTLKTTEGADVAVEVADDLASITATATGLTGDVVYNLYTLSADGDVYVLAESNTTGVFEISQRVKYYVQAVVYGENIAATAATDIEYIFACDHSVSVTDKVVDPTCSKGGYTEHTCDDCGHKWTTDPTAIDPNAHAWVAGECDATRVTAGTQYYTCKHDAGHTKTEPAAATGTQAVINAYNAAINELTELKGAATATEVADVYSAAIDSVNTEAVKTVEELDDDALIAKLAEIVATAKIKGGMLNVKFQIKAGTNADSTATNLRLISSIAVPVLEGGEYDLGAYNEVGFKITVGGVTTTFTTNKIYKEITGTAELSGTDVTYTVSQFYDGSNFFFTVIIRNIPKDAFGTDMTVQAFYTDAAGNTVEGVEKTRNINDFLPAESGN